MATIIPFKAVRPTRDKVGLIASRSYDDYSLKERNARLRDNPFSFLHILNPGFKYRKSISGERRYSLVRNRYLEFKEDGIFTQDDTPCYYFYKKVNRDGNEFNGIIAGASTREYEEDLIKKHEHTISSRQTLFKDYLKTVGFNAEPVLLTYPDNSELKEIIHDVMRSRAEYEFTTTYRDTHYIWIVYQQEIIDKVAKLFSSMDKLYIADGHHRCASSYLLYHEMKDENKGHGGNEDYNYFMSYLIPESDLMIFEFNRLVKDLNGLSKEEFLIMLDESFRVEDRGIEYYKPSKKKHFSMYLDGKFYSLYLRKKRYNANNALEDLDVQILYKTILNPILGIIDPRKDNRLSYSHGKNDLSHISKLVNSGKFAVGFGLLPISTTEMKKVADEGLTMPPKSTFIEPKLRSGITIYEF